MSDDRVNEAQCETRFCNCKNLQPCTCINYPPYHCGGCGREFTAQQLAAAKQKGWYSEARVGAARQLNRN